MTNIQLNVSSGSGDWRAYALSNFPCFPFVLDGKPFASPEGFIQGIKFPPSDPRREEAFKLWGKRAKEIGLQAESVSVWWDDKCFGYNSQEHQSLIKRAIRQKFIYNNGAADALIATVGIELIHDVGPESP